jgi:hypothetical protein
VSIPRPSRHSRPTPARARADDRSARLLLAHLHALYGFPRPLRPFVDALRRYPVEVLRDAEHAFRDQVHRDDIRDRQAYFAAIVRRYAEVHRLRRLRQRRNDEQLAQLRRELAEHAALRSARWADPAASLRHGLELLALQGHPQNGSLLFGGVRPGSGTVRAAWQRLVELHGKAAAGDVVRGVLVAFRNAQQHRRPPLALDAIEALVHRLLNGDPTQTPNDTFATPPPPAILPSTGRNQCPPPPPYLRI